jgi:hypothetical protein
MSSSFHADKIVKRDFSEVLIMLLFLSFIWFSRCGLQWICSISAHNFKYRIFTRILVIFAKHGLRAPHRYHVWNCSRIEKCFMQNLCLVVCGISVNHNFLFSIIDIYWNITTLHVSVVLTTIRHFIDNKIYQCSLLNCLCNGSVATGLIM